MGLGGVQGLRQGWALGRGAGAGASTQICPSLRPLQPRWHCPATEARASWAWGCAPSLPLQDPGMGQAVHRHQSKPEPRAGDQRLVPAAVPRVGTYPVPVGADLLHLEALGTVALGHLPVHLRGHAQLSPRQGPHPSSPHRCPPPHLVLDLIGIGGAAQRVTVGVQSTDELVVVDEAVAVHVEDAGHGIHLQDVGGELCGGTATLSPPVPAPSASSSPPSTHWRQGHSR